MDELVRHCLRELSFDGDLGCDVSRLRDFVAESYAHPSSSQVQGQNVDDAFCAFVWSVIVQQPGVRVGTIPPGGSTEVYIAPQASAIRKAKAKGVDVSEEPAPAPATGLDAVSDAALRPLEDLKQQYGDQLRIAVDPETTFAALTGSHFRPSKLTPMIYSGLQIITRGREHGISVVDMGNKSGYDQKTCFYIIKQLVELDLVVKLRQPGISSNIVVHRHFYERSSIWQRVISEERKAVSEEQRNDAEGSDQEADHEETKLFAPVHFDPIDARHLSSMPVLRSRLTKLLKNCPHYIHTSNNLMLRIGFVNPSRTDRRFFRTRLRELMEQGFIEKVQVPHANRKRYPGTKVPCIRLVTDEAAGPSQGEAVPMEDDDFEEIDANTEDFTGLRTNVSLHRQIVDCLAEAGTKGMTLNEISTVLGDFDRRTIDLLINRLEKDPPPAHLADLGIAQLAETHGRERRYKYYTVAHYLALAEKEQVEDRRYQVVDMSAVGGFCPVEESAFYQDETELIRHVNAMKVSKRDDTALEGKKKRGNPVLADGSVKKGRPRKSTQSAEGQGDLKAISAKKSRKRKREVTEGDAAGGANADGAAEGTEELPPRKRRGRPPKNKDASELDASQPMPAPRKRGRPRKSVVDEAKQCQPGAEGSSSVLQTKRQRKARPRNVRIPSPSADTPDLDVSAVSSPLSSLPPSPSPDVHVGGMVEVEGPSLEPAPVMNPPMAEPNVTVELQPAPSPPSPIETTSLHLRRSARAPKVRQRCDSLSPSRRRSRGGRPSTHVAPDQTPATEKPVDSMQVVEEQAPTPLPDAAAKVLEDEGSKVDQPSTHIPPLPSTGSVSAPLSFHFDTHPEIPIDPALLQLEGFSLAAHTLIRMTPEPPELPQAGPSTVSDASRKRDQQETAFGEPLSKRTKSHDVNKFRSKTNISQPRRESEVLRVLEEAGGIMNTSGKEIYEAHAVLVESIVKAGGTASIPTGARIDKRTLEATLKNLESKGKVKLLTTSVPTLTGSRRLARVAYLPETTSDAVNVFLSNLSQALQIHQIPYSVPLKTVEEPLAYGGGRVKAPSRLSTLVRHDTADEEPQYKITDTGQLPELFKRDDQTIRDALCSEKNTVAQLYGYIVGKAARARTLHSLTIGLFENGVASPHIVSAENRTIHLSYYFTDIPVLAFCALIATVRANEELGQLLQSPGCRDSRVGTLNDNILGTLTPAHSRSRARILSLMGMLQVLGVVTPLVPSESQTPAFTYTQSNVSLHPLSFDIAPPGPYTPAAAPLYWRFTDIVPINLWALGEGLPPVWKTVPVATRDQIAAFWDNLEKVSTDFFYAQEVLGSAPASAGTASEEVATTGKTLRRTVSWSAVYNLSLYQTEYLRQFMDPATGNTPLDDENKREDWLTRVAWVVSASKDVVVHWCEKARKKHLRDLRKLKTGGKGKGKKKEFNEDAGAVVARRVAEAKEQRERDWEDMLRRVHPGELLASAEQRVRRVKTKFLQSAGKVNEKWEFKIREAIKEADMVAENLLSTARVPRFQQAPVAKPAPPVAVVTAVQEKDIEELIASQGPHVAKNATTGKKTKKGKEKDTGDSDIKTPRRHRFLWNRDYDELVRDASVIIKARCRGPNRLDWGAVEQVFPAVPRNSVRQRLVHLREVPGTETYLVRLEDKWYELWEQHRGTDTLPDPDPESATNFDLATHIKFLRKHIDKNAIRVGFVEVQTSQNVDLPASLEHIERYYDVVEKVPNTPLWDFMWTVVAEEAREKQFAHQAFTAELGEMPPVANYETEFLSVADAAVRMVLGNPNETYDADVASQLLKGVGEEPVRATTTELLNRGVLAKTVRDPKKPKPGRTLKISDSNLNSLSGQLPSELFQDAAALEDLIGQQEDVSEQWQEWSTLAADGDTAFLLELASENKVRFDVDTSHSQMMRNRIDWNSKKADDDDIETAVRVRYVDVTGPSREASIPEPSAEPVGSVAGAEMQVDELSIPEHGKRTDGAISFCRLDSAGLVDCDGCLEQARRTFQRDLSTADSSLLEEVLTVLDEAGTAGLGKQQLTSKFGSLLPPALFSVVQRMTEASIPLAHWTGYTGVTLVLSAAIRPWTVTVSEARESYRRRMVFPRRWLDMHGRKLNEVWEAALRAVVGLVLLRPGISQAEIRWRLRSVYDRQEVRELLQTLQDEGYIAPRVDAVHRTFEGGPADECEEKVTFWFLTNGGRRWYQV